MEKSIASFTKEYGNSIRRALRKKATTRPLRGLRGHRRSNAGNDAFTAKEYDKAIYPVRPERLWPRASVWTDSNAVFNSALAYESKRATWPRRSRATSSASPSAMTKAEISLRGQPAEAQWGSERGHRHHAGRAQASTTKGTDAGRGGLPPCKRPGRVSEVVDQRGGKRSEGPGNCVLHSPAGPASTRARPTRRAAPTR